MKSVNFLLNHRFVTKIAKLMKISCYIAILVFVLLVVLCFMGRLQYDITVGTTTYENVVYSGKPYQYATGLSMDNVDSLRVHAEAEDGTIGLPTYIAIVCMYTISMIPLIFAFWFLARVFDNVIRGEIFVEKNAQYLLYFGMIQGLVALVAPFVRLLIAQIANALVADRISLATGSDIINQLIPSMAFFVAAYIINYGVHLQDEVDHTL